MIKLESYACGQWQQGEGGETMLNALTGEPVAQVSSKGLDFAAMLAHARLPQPHRRGAKRVGILRVGHPHVSAQLTQQATGGEAAFAQAHDEDRAATPVHAEAINRLEAGGYRLEVLA